MQKLQPRSEMSETKGSHDAYPGFPFVASFTLGASRPSTPSKVGLCLAPNNMNASSHEFQATTHSILHSPL
jgi:hypothetical protein